MRPFPIKVRSSLPFLLWMLLLGGGLLLAWPAGGEARRAQAAPAPQAISPLSTPRAAAPIAMPKLLARHAFGDRTVGLLDLAMDRAAGRLYLADDSGHLYVLDANTLETIAELPVAGLLTLDPERSRLYVAPGEAYALDGAGVQVTIIDTQSLETVGTIPDARYISLDHEHDRIYAGNPLPMPPPLGMTNGPDRGVRIYAADTLEMLTESAEVGIPVYDPVANKLLLVAYTVSVLDPEVLTVERDLLPDLKEQPFPGCNGCERAWSATVDLEHEIVAVTMTKSSTNGPGFPLAPRTFDAGTLEPITDKLAQPTIQPTCSSTTLLLWPEAGTQYWQDRYVRTVVYRNLRVTDAEGAEVAWRDGLGLRFIHPQLGYAIADAGTVLDLARLTPAGRTAEFCTMLFDGETGRIYGSNGNELVVLAEEGGESLPPPPTEAEPLPERAITQIVVSPAYAEDQTLFVLMDDALLYCSTDGGQTWSRVQGGLPTGNGVTLDVAFSPAYATDGTLFAGGHTGEWLGHGVLRSTDRGDTWQPNWEGMPNLRVYQVAVSPQYATDASVWAYAEFTRLHPWQTGAALQRSTDGGLTWSAVITASDALALPSPDELFETQAAAIPVRISDDRRQLVMLGAGAETETVELQKGDDEYLLAVMPAPAYPDDPSLYVLGDWAIWRSQDDGATWSRWRTPELAAHDFDYRLTALAFAPRAAGDGYQLLVGTSTGDLLTLTPSGANPLPQPRAGAQTGVTPVATVAATPAATTTLTATLPVATPTPAEGAATPVAGLTGEPPAGMYRPQGALATLWDAEPRTQQELGWATVQTSLPMGAAVQPFEHGLMIWRGDTGEIYVLYDDHTWEVHVDDFQEGEPESDPALDAPRGLHQPIRGFGKLWRSHDEMRDKLGWARGKEQGFQGYVHPFEHGLLISSGTGILILAEDAAGKQSWR